MTQDDNNLISLNEISAGTVVRIATIDAGHELKNRLAAMGLLTNVEIRVIRNDRAGQIIINLKNSKVILGRGMSHKVFVTEI